MCSRIAWAAIAVAVLVLSSSALPAQTGGFGGDRPKDASAGSRPGELAEVHRVGTGARTLVLLPCMSGRWRSFDTFMRRNAARYTMYAVTVPGYGGSPYPELPRNGKTTVWRANAISGLEKLFREEKIERAVLVGQSWGTSLAVEFAGRHPRLVTHIVNLDGFLHQTLADEKRTDEERLREARFVVSSYGKKLASAEAWARFNSCSITDPERRLLHHGMFMATNRDVLFQYWRENFLARINDSLRKANCRILDIHTIRRGLPNREERAAGRLRELEEIGVSKKVRTVTWFDASHFVHESHGSEVDRAIANFLAGKPVRDDFDRARK